MANTINVKDLRGFSGNGMDDDTVSFQKCLYKASNNSLTVIIPENTTVRITRNLFLYGNVTIEGKSVNNSIIELDSDLSADRDLGFRVIPHFKEFWINFGIPAFGGELRAWTGQIRNITLRVTANGKCDGTVQSNQESQVVLVEMMKLWDEARGEVIAQFKEYKEQPSLGNMIMLHRAENFVIENCIFDLRPIEHINGGNCIGGGQPTHWYSGSFYPSPALNHGVIRNCKLFGAAYGEPRPFRNSEGKITVNGGGGAAINIGGGQRGDEGFTRSLVIENNYIEGFKDDAIALIACSDCVVQFNYAKGLQSRIGAFSGSNNKFIGNVLERQPGKDGRWYIEESRYPASDFFYCGMIPGQRSRPKNMRFERNFGYLPREAPNPQDAKGNPLRYAFMAIAGAESCEVVDNIFRNDSRQDKLPCILVTAIVDHEGIKGCKNSEGKYYAYKTYAYQPGKVCVRDNIMEGNCPGEIIEKFETQNHLQPGPEVDDPCKPYLADGESDFVGPITYQDNVAGGYDIQSNVSQSINCKTIPTCNKLIIQKPWLRVIALIKDYLPDPMKRLLTQIRPIE
ncbi:MAG: hypothetical protein HZB18_11015 [Chloroflexi bacterium]|nr:hypothetical protein [Chloroflexota bacterium]